MSIRPVSVEHTPEHSSSTLFSTALLPSHTILPHKMRCTALTVLFFAFIALFSTMAYAAPVAPQGVIVKRQTCSMSECRGATSTPAAASSSDDRITLISSVITQLLALMGTSNNAPSNDVSTPTVVTASSSSAAPASDPTGV